MGFIGSLFNSTDYVAPQLSNVGDLTVTHKAMQDAASGVAQQQNLTNQLAAQNGIGNQSQVYNQQQALADQLALMAQGGGPNPAMAQLNNTTGANIANQAALMAGQRGAGSNAGLIARQAAQQGGALQQQAVGQGAAMRAQQQLGAISALQGQQNMLGGLAGQQVAQQQGALNSLNQGLVNQQNTQLGIIDRQNANALGASGQQNDSRQANAKIQSDLFKGAASSAGAAMGVGAAAAGGMVPQSSGNSTAILKENTSGPRSKVGQHLTAAFAKGGKVHNMRTGGHVPGKPAVGGAKDSYSNDTVDAKLSPGEIVLPRSVTKSSDPVKASAKFVASVLARKGK